MKTKDKIAKRSVQVLEHKREPVGDKFTINRSNLEREMHKQVEFMAANSELLAEATYQVARLEERKKTRRSEIIIKVEKNPSLLPSNKNVQNIEAYYRLDTQYQDIVNQLLEWQYKLTLLTGMSYTLGQRRDMLDAFNRRDIAMNSISTGDREEKRARTNDKVKKRLNK